MSGESGKPGAQPCVIFTGGNHLYEERIRVLEESLRRKSHEARMLRETLDLMGDLGPMPKVGVLLLLAETALSAVENCEQLPGHQQTALDSCAISLRGIISLLRHMRGASP